MDSRIDTICVLSQGVVTNYLVDKQYYTPLPENNSKLVAYDTKHSLLFFYTLIMNYLSQSNMPDFIFTEYSGEKFEF